MTRTVSIFLKRNHDEIDMFAHCTAVHVMRCRGFKLCIAIRDWHNGDSHQRPAIGNA